MKRIVSMFLAVAVTTMATWCPGLGLSRSGAAETKPIAVLAVASYNDLVSDVQFFGELVGRPKLVEAFNGGVAVVTQFKGLAGVNKTRPWGAVVQASGEEDFSGYAFVPVFDLDQFLDLLKLYGTVEAEGGLNKLTTKPDFGGKVLYIKSQGAWAFLADKAESLAHCEADPSALLEKQDKDYIVHGRILLGNVPTSLREKFLEKFKEGFEKEAAQKEDESSEDFASRKKVIEKLQPYLTRVLGDLDQIVFGWGLDRTNEKTFLDVSVTARPDTKTAEEMALAGEATTNLAGFLVPHSTMSLIFAGKIPEAKQEIASTVIEVIRAKALADVEKKAKKDDQELAKQMVNDLVDIMQKIVKGGHMDGAVSVILGPETFTAVVGGYVADGDKLDKMIRKIVKTAILEHPDSANMIELDAERSHGVNFHKFTVPLTEETEDVQNLRKLCGDKLEIVVGVGKEYACMGFGRDALATVKKAVEVSGHSPAKSVPPLEVSLAVKPLMGFAAAMGKPEDRAQAELFVSLLEKTPPGKDHIVLAVRPITNGVQVHLEVEQGLVRMFGRLVELEMKKSQPKAPKEE